jgi:uncharacterized protein (TIGR03437 family)
VHGCALFEPQIKEVLVMSHRILTTSAVCLAAAASALHAQRLFVQPGALSSSQTVEVLATSPVSAITGFQAGAGNFLVLGLPSGSTYYAIGSSTNQSITAVDDTFLTPQKIAALPQPATAAVLSPDGTRLAVAAGTLHIFDTATNADMVAGGINVGTGISVIDVAASLDGQTFYSLGVAGSSTQVNAINIVSNTITHTLGFSGVATSITVGPNGLIYVTLPNQVVDINPTTFAGNPAGPIAMNATPGRPAFTTDGKYALFANQTPVTGTSLLLVSLANRAVVSTAQSLQIALDTLLVTGTDTILAYSSSTQQAYQITVSSTGTLAIGAFTIPGSSNSASALTISSEVPYTSVPYVDAVYVVSNGIVEQLNPQSGQLLSQSNVPTGLSAAALSYTLPAVTGSQPAVVLPYGGGQVLANNATSAPIVVRVLNTNGLPISGVTVSFATNGPGTTLSPTSGVTSSSGYAVTYLTSGSTNAQFQVTATAGAQSAEIQMTVGLPTGATAGGLSFVSGQGQMLPEEYDTASGLAGSHLSVLVTNSSGNPLPGAPVTFLITQGTGTLELPTGGATSQTVDSNSTGVATVDFLSPALVGSAVTYGYAQTQVTASAPGTTSLIFTITTYPIDDAPTSIQTKPQPGSTITGEVNEILPSALQYQITSYTGYPVPGVGVNLSNGGLNPTLYPSATCSDPTSAGVLSNGSGTITCNLAIGPRVGTASITANIGYAVNLSSFPLVVSPGAPATVKLVEGNNQTGLPGATLSTPLVVEVTDEEGNILAGTKVTWTVVKAGTAALTQVISTTDYNGLASAVVTLGTTGGPVQVTATAGSVTVTFNLSVAVSSLGIQKVSGDAQSAVLSTAFTSPLVVEVTGSGGSAVAGALVTFQVTSGSATLGSSTGTSGANGQVSTTVQAGATPGPVTITATTASYSVTFNLTVLPVGPANLVFVNGASFQAGTGIAPGSIAILTGSGILPGVEGLILANNIVGPLPLSLQGVSITFGGLAAPIYYVMNSGGVEQVAVQVPFELIPAGTTTVSNVSVVVTSSNGVAATISVPVKPFAPGIFSTTSGGLTYAVATRPDGSYVSPTNPAQLGEDITLYVTGLGPVTPAASTGDAGIPGQAVVVPLIIGLNNSGVPLISANYVQGLIGVYAVTFHVPAVTATGPAEPLAVVAYDSAGHFYYSQGIGLPVQ